jgi:hypothetical protein
MLIYFDFIGKSVRYSHVFCLDLLPQNTDDIALVVLPVLPFPGKFMGWAMPSPPLLTGKADPAFANGPDPHTLVI